MGTLLERPLIKKDFDEKYPSVVNKMHEMLNEAKVMYNKQVKSSNYIKLYTYFMSGPSLSEKKLRLFSQQFYNLY